MSKKALLFSIFVHSGGVKTMLDFVMETLISLGIKIDLVYYKPYKIDKTLSSPIWKFWKKPSVRRILINEMVTIYEYGVKFNEFEYRRYLPNEFFRKLLNKDYNYYLCISGSPLPAYPYVFYKKYFLGWFATSFFDDRKGRNYSLLRKIIEFFNIRKCAELQRKIIASFNNNILVLSKYTGRMLSQETGIERNFKVMYMPIDKKYFNYDKSVAKENIIVLPARLDDPRKNILLALQALNCLVNSLNYKKIKLIMVGGDLPSKIRNYIIRNSLETYIQHYGYLPREELAKLYKIAKIVLLTSYQEGLGIVIPEAMACGCVPVITKCGGPEEIVRECGFVCNFDYEKIAKSIKLLLDDAMLYKYRQYKSLKMVSTKFDYDIIKESFIEELNNFKKI